MRTYILVILCFIFLVFSGCALLCFCLSFHEQWYFTAVSRGIKDFFFFKCSYKEHGDIYRKNAMWIENDIESGFKAYSKYKKCMKWNPVIKKYIFQELFPHMSRTERNCKILSIGSEGPWAISCWNISCWCVWRFVIVGNCESPFLNSSQSTVMWWGVM